MITRIITVALLALSLGSAGVLISKNATITELEQTASDTADALEQRNKTIATLELSIEQQATTIEDMRKDSKQREALIINHYKSIQSEFDRTQRAEAELTEVITNDKNSTDWAYIALPADVKRVFDYATGTTSDNGDQASQGVAACASAQCMRATEDERDQ
ncbi:MAG: hypothetical protein ACI846_000118 [Pseudoalteromonas distincta]|jgi:uncharacterized protein (DUF3084 family)